MILVGKSMIVSQQRRTLFRHFTQTYSSLSRLPSHVLGRHANESAIKQNFQSIYNTCSQCRQKQAEGIIRSLHQRTSHPTFIDYLKINSNTNQKLLKMSRSICVRYSVRSIHHQAAWLGVDSSKDVMPKLHKTTSLKRTGRKKPSVENTVDNILHDDVVSYAVGEGVDLNLLKQHFIKQDVYSLVELPQDIRDALMITAKYKTSIDNRTRDAFFFSDGSMACWHMGESEMHGLRQVARSFSPQPYSNALIEEKSESLTVKYDRETRLKDDIIYLKSQKEGMADEEHALHKLTFSNALSQSVSLNVKEAFLEDFIDQLEPETKKLRSGEKSSLKNRDVTKMLGEVFQLRHVINLESGYLDYPDIYWEREELEKLYKQMNLNFVIPKRITIFNERLNYCSEILNLINNQLNDGHHVRLEWIIIVLILIEVMFEIFHYMEKYRYTNSLQEVSDDKP